MVGDSGRILPKAFCTSGGASLRSKMNEVVAWSATGASCTPGHGVAAVKKHWKRDVFPRQIAALPPPSAPAPSRATGALPVTRRCSPPCDFCTTSTGCTWHATSFGSSSRLVARRRPRSLVTGVGREHKDGVNSYWWRYSAPVRRSLVTGVGREHKDGVTPEDCSEMAAL